MANYVPPEFQGIDYSQYHNWPQVKVGSNVYYQVPGISDFVYDPSRGQQGSYIRTDSLQTQYRDTHPKIPSLGSQIAQGGALIGATTLGRIGASALGNSIFGGGSSAGPGAVVAAPSSSGGGILSSLGSLFGGGASSPTGIGPIADGGGYASELGALGPVADGGQYAGLLGGAADGGGMLSGLGGTALAAAPYAGIGAGLFGLYEGFKNRNKGEGALGGAATGAGIGTLVAPGIGTAIGAGAGGLLGLGESLFEHKKSTDAEGNLTRDLNSQGVKTIEDGTKPDEVRNRQQQADDYKKQYGLNDSFQGYTPDKKWVNNQGLTTGDVKSLRTQDTTGYSVWSKALGNDYYNTTSDDRSKINSYALQNGLVKEGKGSLSLDGDQAALDKFHDYANSVIAGKDDAAQDYRSRWDYDVIKQSQADGSSGAPTSVSADSPSTSDSSNPTPKVDEATANTGVSLPGTPFAKIPGVGSSPIQTNLLTGKPLIVGDPTDPVTPMMTKFSAVAAPNSQSIQLQPLTVGKLGVSTIQNPNFSYRYV